MCYRRRWGELLSTVSPAAVPLCGLNLPSGGKRGEKKRNPQSVSPVSSLIITLNFLSVYDFQKKWGRFTVYALESVFGPRYRSENADAAVLEKGKAWLERSAVIRDYSISMSSL